MQTLEDMKIKLDDYSDKTWLISFMSKILLNIVENDDGNIKEIDKIGLIVLIDRMIEEQKTKIIEIKMDLFGI